MNAQKILYPVDFSLCSNVAFQHAEQLARCNHAQLVIVHVSAPPPTFISGYAGYGALPTYRPKPDSRLEEMHVTDDSVRLERVHLVGIEGEAIVKFAAETGCDLIVLGTHGYRGFTKLLIGSVADYVLRHAKCPVFVIKDKCREQQSSNQDSAVAG